LVVERFGADGRFLWISDASPNVETPVGAAPDDLIVGNTLFGMLARTSQDQSVAHFMFIRHLPRDGTTEGVFFPADGMATLTGHAGDLTLTASGRHFHTQAEVDGQTFLHDVPHPAPGAKGGISWQFDAAKRPWAKQIL